MRHIGIFIVATALMAAAHAEPKAGGACEGNGAHAIGPNGELLGCVSEQPKWRLADQNNCQIHAGEIIDGAKAKYGDVKGTVLRVSVSQNLCLETSRFHNFTIGDMKAWKVEVVARDEKQQPLAYKITPKAKDSMTDLYLQDSDGYTYSLMLQSAK